MSRRHKLHSEASYRFERGVDRELPLRATAKAVALLSGLGGGRVVPGCTHAQAEVPPVVITMATDYPDRVAGVIFGRDTVVKRLRPRSRHGEPSPPNPSPTRLHRIRRTPRCPC
jgi:phenylalanyl-tRNA synthetase beta chain